GADPEFDRPGADHGRVVRQRLAEIGDGASRRALFPVVFGGRGPEAVFARAGVTTEVRRRQRFGVPGEAVGVRFSRRLVAEAAVRREIPGAAFGGRDRELVERFFEARIGLPGRGAAG